MNVNLDTSAKNEIVLFTLNKSYGFFSMFFHLCKAYIYASKMNIPFFITHNDWAYNFKSGWYDYFDSLQYFVSDNNYSIIHCKHISIPSFIPTYKNNDYIDCIKKIFILKPFIINKATEYINNVLQNNYIAIYVRRGDKYTETKFIPEETIINKINPDINTNIFIQTDDYTVVENFKRLLPNHNIFYIIPENKRGHYQSNLYLNKSNDNNKYKSLCVPFNDINDPEYIFNDTTELLTGMYICSKAAQCWVDYSSNVGRFIKLFAFDNTFSYNTSKPVILENTVEPFYYI